MYRAKASEHVKAGDMALSMWRESPSLTTTKSVTSSFVSQSTSWGRMPHFGVSSTSSIPRDGTSPFASLSRKRTKYFLISVNTAPLKASFAKREQQGWSTEITLWQRVAD